MRTLLAAFFLLCGHMSQAQEPITFATPEHSAPWAAQEPALQSLPVYVMEGVFLGKLGIYDYKFEDQETASQDDIFGGGTVRVQTDQLEAFSGTAAKEQLAKKDPYYDPEAAANAGVFGAEADIVAKDWSWVLEASDQELMALDYEEFLATTPFSDLQLAQGEQEGLLVLSALVDEAERKDLCMVKIDELKAFMNSEFPKLAYGYFPTEVPLYLSPTRLLFVGNIPQVMVGTHPMRATVADQVRSLAGTSGFQLKTTEPRGTLPMDATKFASSLEAALAMVNVYGTRQPEGWRVDMHVPGTSATYHFQAGDDVLAVKRPEVYDLVGSLLTDQPKSSDDFVWIEELTFDTFSWQDHLDGEERMVLDKAFEVARTAWEGGKLTAYHPDLLFLPKQLARGKADMALVSLDSAGYAYFMDSQGADNAEELFGSYTSEAYEGVDFGDTEVNTYYAATDIRGVKLVRRIESVDGKLGGGMWALTFLVADSGAEVVRPIVTLKLDEAKDMVEIQALASFLNRQQLPHTAQLLGFGLN